MPKTKNRKDTPHNLRVFPLVFRLADNRFFFTALSYHKNAKSLWKKENQIENAKGGAKIVYDAMNFVNAKAAKIEAVKKASADALVTVALSDWQYGFDENKGSSPSRTVYRVKLPFDAAFVINMKTKPTQKDAQAVFDALMMYWDDFRAIYNGTGAKYTTMDRVRECFGIKA